MEPPKRKKIFRYRKIDRDFLWPCIHPGVCGLPKTRRCDPCQRRRVCYGSHEATRFGKLSVLPSMRYVAALKNNVFSRYQQYDEELVDMRKLAVFAIKDSFTLAAYVYHKHRMTDAREFGWRIVEQIAEDDTAHEGTLKLMESWAYYLLAPLPAEGICKNERGLVGALARYWLVRVHWEKCWKRPENYYGPMRQIMPIFIAAAEPYIRLWRIACAKNIVNLTKKEEDWWNYRGKKLR